MILIRISRISDNMVVRVCRVCHEYQQVVFVVVAGSWNTQRMNRMMAVVLAIMFATWRKGRAELFGGLPVRRLGPPQRVPAAIFGPGGVLTLVLWFVDGVQLYHH